MRTVLASIFLIITILPIESQCNQSEEEWKDYFIYSLSGLDPIEGIWSISARSSLYRNGIFINSKDIDQVVKLATYKSGDDFETCLLGHTNNVNHSFEKSSIPGIYIAEVSFGGTNSKATSQAIIEGSSYIEFEYWLPKDVVDMNTGGDGYTEGYRIQIEQQWIKMYPSRQDISEVPKSFSSSATGFMLASDGLLITNYHVIKDALSIKVRGVNGDYNSSLNGEVLFSDPNNDLALLKINDPNFTTSKGIPYTIKRKQSSVGEEVYVLGYPLRSTMGDEIKLTDGIISSKTGYQGDITAYQISAPVQPGNSGGPVFDKHGNIIGIISSKHSDADNATYVVKSNYILSIIDLLDNPPSLLEESELFDTTLPSLVKTVKEFVYIIEVN